MAKATNDAHPVERDPKWEHIQAELSKPFEAKYISVKPGATTETSALMLWFIDARAVMSRLDAVVGPENWSFSWSPIPSTDGRVAIHGTLKIFDAVKEDVGEAQDEDEPYKSAVSDAFKRCAVHFGLGRYLYSMPQMWWPFDRAKRRVSNPEELEAFINRVVDKLIELNGDSTKLNIRELQAETSSMGGHDGQLAGSATPAQQERIKELQTQKFGLTADARVRYEQLQKSTIGRVCKRSELRKYEADKMIKALLALPYYQESAA